MSPSRIAVGAVLLGLSCGAQQGRSGNGGGAAVASDGSPSVVHDLYRQAKRSIGSLPEEVAPQLFADVARDEMRLYPSEAEEDYATAFTMALALPPPESESDDAGQAREQVKELTEMEAVRGLASHGHANQALELARLADVPKGPLYDQLILAAGSKDDSADAAEAAPKLADMVFNLAQECKQADGTYPYKGVATALARLDALDRVGIVEDAYQWAANETDPARMIAAEALFQAGHELVPELDGQLEAALVAMLGTLGQNGATAPFGTGAHPGNLLMSLLTEVDPPRAQALAAHYPGLGAAAISNFNLGGTGGGGTPYFSLNGASGNSLTFTFPLAAAADASSLDSGAAVGSAQFAALVAQAESLSHRDPGSALDLANQAAELLDGSWSNALWATETEPAARLAQLYAQLGAGADSARILSRCLDEADRQARAADTSFRIAGPDQQALMAQGLEAPQSAALEVYSLAARLDLAATAERAEATQFVLLKPAILLRVALVAAVNQPAADRP